MSKVNFWIPLSFQQPKTWSQSLLEKADNYFLTDDLCFGKHGNTYVVLSQERGITNVSLTSQADRDGFLITALKVASYFTLVIPALIFIAKIILRSQYTLYIIVDRSPFDMLPRNDFHAQATFKLSEGFDIPIQTQKEIETLMPLLFAAEDDQEIQWVSKTPSNRIFKLSGHPNLIFKMDRVKPESIKERFDNMVKAKSICLRNKLDQIFIPSAKLFAVHHEGREIPILAQEFIPDSDFHPAGTALFQIGSLSTFLCKQNLSPKEAIEINGRAAILDFEKISPADEEKEDSHQIQA